MHGLQSKDPWQGVMTHADSEVSKADNPEIEKCNFCFGNLGNQRTVVLFPCTHSYHKLCIGEFLEVPQNTTCPGCNHSVTHCLSPDETPLLVAAAKGRPDAISGMLALGVNVNDSTEDGLTPLHCAAIKGDVATLEQLVRHGANVNALTRGMTPLHFAAQCGHHDTIWFLLENGANINYQANVMETPSQIQDRRDWNVLLASVEKWQGLPLGSTLEYHGSDAQITSYGKTPLHCAIEAGHEQVVNDLAVAGADIEVLIGEGKTLLSWAKSEGKLTKPIISSLASATCDTEAYCEGARAELLGALIEINDWALFDKLLGNTRGADIDKLRCPGSSQLAFFQSVECGQTDNIKAMITRGADVNCLNDRGMTPLYRAVDEGQPESVATLIAGNADVNATMGDYKWTALHLAAKKGEASIVQLLIEANVNVDACISDGETPLPPKKAFDRYKTNTTNGGTPLHIAVESCQPEIVERLIAASADVNALNAAVHTPLKVAQVLCDTAIYRVENLNDFAALNKIESYETIIELLHSVNAGSGFEY
ncbi:ankyrin repeat domain-containing protein [Salinisphaera sp. G21_0]|uniref:ankyrin repeat domain-containing protein n=1 Tax=Salinisphaera sp. G21_0 TaxID=2821094 RepID=UPI001ADA9EAE|nr:ankyrin repeat domain-containing protein [Salinisphaera sp. G21_0]MBO9481509.1 ankyrin repeat domain-containing protein [Salinisphaera sp. G21_0]